MLPHISKLTAAKVNQSITEGDRNLMATAVEYYDIWVSELADVKATSDEALVADMVRLTNDYKDAIELDLIMAQGSDALRRQKGQMKIDNSILEEFLVHLFSRFTWAEGYENGPRTSLLSIAFDASGPTIKTKNHDHVLGQRVSYRFTDAQSLNASGDFVIPHVATEIKINLDKTMFQEAAGTAARMKVGCPNSRYFMLTEYLDMGVDDATCTNTAVDNVFLLRRAKRLGADKRHKLDDVRAFRKDHPLCASVMNNFVAAVKSAIQEEKNDLSALLAQGSFM